MTNPMTNEKQDALRALDELSMYTRMGDWLRISILIETIRNVITQTERIENWRDISTAPKNGHAIFLVTGQTEQPCVVTRAAKNWKDSGYPFAAYHTQVVFPEGKFTHWRPLPKLPHYDLVKKSEGPAAQTTEKPNE